MSEQPTRDYTAPTVTPTPVASPTVTPAPETTPTAPTAPTAPTVTPAPVASPPVTSAPVEAKGTDHDYGKPLGAVEDSGSVYIGYSDGKVKRVLDTPEGGFEDVETIGDGSQKFVAFLNVPSHNPPFAFLSDDGRLYRPAVVSGPALPTVPASK